MNIPQYFNGKQVGNLNKETGVYSRIVGKNQMMIHPKYQGMLSCSQSILKKIIKEGWKKNDWTIMEWENEPFHAIITKEDFLSNMEELHFKGKENSDKQFGVRLHFWTRVYLNQRRIDEVKI